MLEILHTVPSAFVLAAFFMMGISAWHLLKKQHIDFFTRSFNIGLVVGLFVFPFYRGGHQVTCTPFM